MGRRLFLLLLKKPSSGVLSREFPSTYQSTPRGPRFFATLLDNFEQPVGFGFD
jgi:hypothetical protein